MGVGKFLAIIGGIIGILSVALFYFMPEIFSLWSLDAGPTNVILYLGGFGSQSGVLVGYGFGPEYANDIFLLIVSLLIVGGSVLTFIAGLKGSKTIGILGGCILLAGPALFILEIITKIGVFGDDILSLFSGVNLLFGSQMGVVWGIRIGSFLAIGGGLLGIIGGATI